MKLDFCSDTHWDFIFDPLEEVLGSKLKKYIERYFGDKDSDYLVIAGDTGHFIRQDQRILEELKKLYKEVFITLGNHNLYCVSKEQRIAYPKWELKVKQQIRIFESSEIKVLNGTIFEIEDKTLGGSMGWYDFSYYYENGFSTPYSQTIESLWKQYNNDSRLIEGLVHPLDIWGIEKAKILGILDKCDVMVTHVQPVIGEKFFHDKFKGDKTNAFFSFNFDKEIQNLTKTKVWIYGHTHEIMDFDLGNLRLVSNPFGYREENGTRARVRTIEI